MEPTQALQKVVDDNKLDPAMRIGLVEMYRPFYEKARAMLEESQKIVVTDPTQVTEIKASGVARRAYKTLRCAAENARKAANAGVLRYKDANDTGNKLLLSVIEPEEARLEAQEKIAERMEAERRAKLVKDRLAALSPYGVTTIIEANLADLTEAQFQNHLRVVKIAHEERVAEAKAAAEAAQKAEEERQAEAARLEAEALAERGRRMAAEREAARQKAEADKFFAEEKRRRDAELAAQQVIALQEREAREKLEREAQALRDAESAKKRAEEEAARKAAAAPDKEKLLALARDIRNRAQTCSVSMTTPAAAEILGYAIFQLGVLASAIENRARAL